MIWTKNFWWRPKNIIKNFESFVFKNKLGWHYLKDFIEEKGSMNFLEN